MKQKGLQSPPKQKIAAKVIRLTSSYLFYELFSFKKYQEPNFLIPDTIILEKGHIKQWIFNSSKQENKILKKRKQNCSPINVVKSFCSKFGFHFADLKTISEIKTELKQIFKQRGRQQTNLPYKKQEDRKIIEIVTVDDDIFTMSLFDFVSYVQENRYSEHMFFQKWKIIREKVNSQSRIDECYEVENVRKNHLIQSKCHKVIALKTSQLTPFSSVDLQNDHFKNVNPQKQFVAAQTRNMQGYKFFDTFLNKKFFKISQQFIEFIEKNYKCIVQEIKTTFVIDKNRQPHLVGIYNLKIKPVKKLTQQEQYIVLAEKGSLKTEEYMRFLNIYLIQYQRAAQSLLAAPLLKIMKNIKCNGNFCDIKVKKLPHLIDPGTHLTPAEKSKMLGLDSLSHPHKRTVFSDMINSVKKRKMKVLEKLKSHGIIQWDQNQNPDDSSEYQSSDEENQKNLRVCQNCYHIYTHTQKYFELDFRSGNLIEKKQLTLTNHSIKRKSQSQKKLPPIFDKSQISEILGNQKPVRQLKRTSTVNGRINSNSQTQKFGSSSLRKIKQREFQNQNQNILTVKNRQIQDLKKVKLEPIESVKAKNSLARGNRLMAISNSIQATQFKQGQRFAKNDNKLNKLPKAKNFQQAENNLVEKLSLLPSTSADQFMYFAKKYYKDNLPQQLDRKSYSSEYFPHLYEFMINSDLTLHPKNKIKKRPEISLKRLSQLTDYPQIVSKSAFHFDTVITDQKTTIPFCVITTRMINGKNAVNIPYENIFIINDIFDCFIEYIPLAKDILQNSVNKRIILFNYPGQSHTIYSKQVPFNLPQFSFILDKLLYRLSSQKQQLGYINFRKDKLKFIGFGYGGYLLTSYLANCLDIYQNNLSGVLLVNTYKTITEAWKQKVQALIQLYKGNDDVVVSEAFLFYSKAIQSSQTDKQDLDYKSGLNPIRVEGRVYVLQSLLDLANLQINHYNLMVQNFENLTAPVHAIYGKSNVLFSKTQAQRFLTYQDTRLKKQEIPQRKFIQLEGGHDLMADNYDDLQRHVEEFVNL